VEALLRDFRHAARLLRRSPGFTLLAALTMALGIGPTTTIFSVANGLLVRTPVGVREPGTLFSVYAREDGVIQYATISYPEFEALREGSNGLYRVAATQVMEVGLSARGGGEPEGVTGMLVSADYFGILGTRPAVGRLLLGTEDDVPSGSPAVVLSHRLWTRRFGADPSIVGRSITINRGSYTVVGVAEEGFQGHMSVADVGLWIPVTMHEALTGSELTRNTASLFGVGRLGSGVALGEARAAMDVVWGRLQREEPETGGEAPGSSAAHGLGRTGVYVAPYSVLADEGRGPVTGYLAMLLMVSGLVLFIASMNVAGVFLARAAARAREIAVRLAVGAGRVHVVRQLLAESVLVFLLGGVAGTVLAFWATRALAAVQLPLPVHMTFDFAPDARVLAIAVLVTLATGVLFGLAPALQAGRQDVAAVLQRGGGSLRGARMRSAFVVAQVAGSVALLIAGGVFLRALARADSADFGFDPRNVHVMAADLTVQRHSDAEAETFWLELQRRAAALPGVATAGVGTSTPMGFRSSFVSFQVPGGELHRLIRFAAVSPGFFETLRIGLLEGRGFEPGDRQGALPVAVVNQAAARRFWPGRDALGQQLEAGDRALTVVGVVRDGEYSSPGTAVGPMVYLSFLQWRAKAATLVVRTLPGAARVDRQVRALALALDPDLPLETNAPYEQVIGVSLLPGRVAAAVAGALGMLGLLLAAVGLFGVLSFVVSTRSREMGIRMALGASPRDVRALVLRQGVRLVAIGLMIGCPLALGGAFLVRGMLYGLSPADPLTYAAVAILLLAAGLLASYLPARRATAADPASVLRAE